ncbi:MAG: class I SAM-dependent methyltransferase [Alphaproteobacteria bacterium]
MNCPACNSRDTALLIPAKKLRARADVLRCNRCRSAFFEERAWRLPDDYWTAGDQESLYASPCVAAQRERRFRSRLEVIGRLAPGKSILDIGCGRGEFIAMAKDRGWNVRGVEPSDTVIPVREDLAECMIRATLESLDYAGPPFDAVALWDVVEHLDDPALGFSKVADLLERGGIAAIETPNEGGLYKLCARLAANVCMGRLLDYVYYLPHRISFSAKGLELLGARFGLTMLRTWTCATDIQFARAKVACHYEDGLARRSVAALLPVAATVARAANKGNKLVVLMKRS